MKEVSVGIGRSSIIAQPSNNFSIDYKIDFEDPAIGVQNQKITNLGSDFDKEIRRLRPVDELFFCNGGDRTNGTNTPEHSVCAELGMHTIYGLGDKIQSSSWLIQ